MDGISKVEAAKVKDDLFEIYLITAKHVIIAYGEAPLHEIFLRLNGQDGKSECLSIALKDYFKVYTHSDKDVDLALLCCVPDQTRYDYSFLSDLTILLWYYTLIFFISLKYL
ncbi:MAG: hypothetical protein WA393_10575 [Nitrososphaeraceae archaeon]